MYPRTGDWGRMSHKTIAVGTIIVAVSAVTLTVFLSETYMAFESINPIAALTASIVVIAGLVWLKKTNNKVKP